MSVNKVSVKLNEASIVDARDKLARLFGLIAVRAGRAIMRLRETGTSTQYKGDGSPVTAADFEADEIIRHCLERNVPDLPVITDWRRHQHGPQSPAAHAFSEIQKPEAFSKSRLVRAGSARSLAGVFQKTPLYSAGAANFKSLASTSSATSAFVDKSNT